MFIARNKTINNLFGLLCLLLCLVTSQARAVAEIRAVVDISDPEAKNWPEIVLNTFISQVPAGTRVGIWTYGRYVNMLVSPSVVDEGWRARAWQAVEEIPDQSHWRNIYDALRLATADWPEQEVALFFFSNASLKISDDAAVNAQSVQEIQTKIIPFLAQHQTKVVSAYSQEGAGKTLLQQLSAINPQGMARVVHNVADLESMIALAATNQPVISIESKTAGKIIEPEWQVNLAEGRKTLYAGEVMRLQIKLAGVDADKTIRSEHYLNDKLEHETILQRNQDGSIEDYVHRPSLSVGQHQIHLAVGEFTSHDFRFTVMANPAKVVVKKPSAKDRHFYIDLRIDAKQLDPDSVWVDTLLYDSARDEFFEVQLSPKDYGYRLSLPMSREKGDYILNAHIEATTKTGESIKLQLPDVVLPYEPIASQPVEQQPVEQQPVEPEPAQPVQPVQSIQPKMMNTEDLIGDGLLQALTQDMAAAQVKQATIAVKTEAAIKKNEAKNLHNQLDVLEQETAETNLSLLTWAILLVGIILINAVVIIVVYQLYQRAKRRNEENIRVLQQEIEGE